MDSWPSDSLWLRGRDLAIRLFGATLAVASVLYAIKYVVQNFTPTRVWILVETDPWIPVAAIVPGAVIAVLLSRANERTAERWHFVIQYALRVAICPILILYGVSKLIGGQFYPSFPSTLDSTISELAGNDLTWAYYGRAYPYVVFMAVPQLAAAVFLLFRRTQLLGALLVVAVFSNIVIINFSYDIGTTVKAISTTVMLAGVYLIALDIDRLKAFFVDARAVPAPSSHPWGPRAARIFLGVHVAVILLWNGPAAVMAHGRVDKLLHSPTPVHGIWDVTASSVDAPSLRAGSRIYFDDVRLVWEERAGKEPSTRHGNIRSGGALQPFVYRARPDGTIELDLPGNGPTFRGRTRLGGDMLRLDGTLDRRPAMITLRRGSLRPGPR